MTAGFPTDSADNAIQFNIVGAGEERERKFIPLGKLPNEIHSPLLWQGLYRQQWRRRESLGHHDALERRRKLHRQPTLVAIGPSTSFGTAEVWNERAEVDALLQYVALCGRTVTGWADEAKILVNGRRESAAITGTFARVEREWKQGDSVEIAFPQLLLESANYNKL
jgi:hypothetical protein